jgi:hypothetical protein
MPTTDEFREEIRAQLREAELAGASEIELNAGQVHRKMGGYPGLNHQMKPCCDALYAEMHDGLDEVLAAPNKRHGASVTIRFGLPRPR